MEQLLTRGQWLTLDLTTMTPHGESIGRHEGLVVFVPYGLPGERVEVEVVHVRRHFARAKIVRRFNDAVERVNPPCPVFGVCGGCQWQHVAYDAQLRFKTAIVRELLTGIGKFADPPVLACVPSPSPYEYRNRMQFSISRDGRPGFHRPGMREIHSVIEIDDCPISHHDIRAQLREWAAGEPLELTHQLDVRVSDRDVEGGSVLRVGAFEYFISPESFFQINVGVAGKIVEAVLEALALGGDESVLDMYCGVGLFTLPLAMRARRVVGIENNRGAIADADRNKAQLPRERQPEFVRADVLKAFARGASEPALQAKWDAIVIDPPRSGVFHDVLKKLIELRPAKIAYVSCDPATLARDLRILCDNGYDLRSAQPFDMFPHTHHIETLAALSLR